MSEENKEKEWSESVSDKELETLARPLIEYLNKNYHPHTAILITSERVAIVETVVSVPECSFVQADSNRTYPERKAGVPREVVS